MKKKIKYCKRMNSEVISAYYTTAAPMMDFFHFHNLRELVFVEKGRCNVITETGKYSAKGPFVMQYPEGMLHMQINDPETEYSRWLVSFDPDFLRDLFGDRVTDSFFLINLDENTAARFRVVFGLLLDAMKEKQTKALDERRKFLIASLYADLIPIIPRNTAETLPAGNCRVFDVCRYIDEHFSEKLTLDILSREFFIGRATLVREFRRILDITVGEYIQNVRIMKAKRMLLLGMSVGETAEKCGYISPSYFVQVFKRKNGQTPTGFLNDGIGTNARNEVSR